MRTGAAIEKAKDGGDKDECGHRCAKQAADHCAAERSILLAAFAEAERHGEHADDHRHGRHALPKLLSFAHNFGNCKPIKKILAQVASGENLLQHSSNKSVNYFILR